MDERGTGRHHRSEIVVQHLVFFAAVEQCITLNRFSKAKGQKSVGGFTWRHT
jgi:hypothetical protein